MWLCHWHHRTHADGLLMLTIKHAGSLGHRPKAPAARHSCHCVEAGPHRARCPAASMQSNGAVVGTSRILAFLSARPGDAIRHTPRAIHAGRIRHIRLAKHEIGGLLNAKSFHATAAATSIHSAPPAVKRVPNRGQIGDMLARLWNGAPKMSACAINPSRGQWSSPDNDNWGAGKGRVRQ